MSRKRAPRIEAEPTQKKPFPIKRALVTLGLTVLFLCVHIIAVEAALLGEVVSIVLFWLFYAAIFALIVIYLIWNRGLLFDSLKKEDLPPDMSETEKDAFLALRDERKRRSRPLLTVLFPLVVVFFYQIISLFFGDSIIAGINTLMGGRK